MRKEVEVDGNNFIVQYDFQPEEVPETGPEAQYPGCGAGITIEGIIYKSVDVSEIIDEYLYDRIEDLLWEDHR